MKLETEIDNLKQMVLKMSDVVVDNIDISINNYLGKTDDIVNDDIVDKFERLIEEMCLNILLKERPYASDLKQVTGILKLVTDLERIGDHAEDIITFSNKLKGVPGDPKHHDNIDNLAQFVIDMLKKAVNSYINADTVNIYATGDDASERYGAILQGGGYLNLRATNNINLSGSGVVLRFNKPRCFASSTHS